jgi:hypothetical protein
VLTSDQKGSLAEQAVVFSAMKEGLGVYSPLGDERYDLILDLRPELDRCYLLPEELSLARAVVHLRLAPSRNHQQTGINWALDFEFGATLARLRGPIAQLGER